MLEHIERGLAPFGDVMMLRAEGAHIGSNIGNNSFAFQTPDVKPHA
jgi:hypothetical protein